MDELPIRRVEILHTITSVMDRMHLAFSTVKWQNHILIFY